MKQKTADDFFNSIDYVSIIDTIKGIYTSDGSMSTLLDFERVLDEADLYAFQNWELGELVQGPTVKRYTVTCVFMWPYKLMPDPRGAKRLLTVGCKIKFAHTKIKVPIEIESYDDYIGGTKYPKSKEREVWLVSIEIPVELMDDIKEGSIDLADQDIDLDELDDAYEDDLDVDDGDGSDDDTTDESAQGMTPDMAAAPVGGQPGM